MKYLLVLLVLAVGWHMWRSQRVKRTPPPPPKKGLAKPEPMVHCAHCGVHLPQSDAIRYQGAHYCSQAHLAQAVPPGKS
ncbi:MAG: hypothetical protein LBE58_13605 [Comamonas sp.]|jgi:uncharacterized protein|nr:hypothetical protein [Comamonas sp.]